MNLKLVTRLVLAIIIGVAVVSCIDEGEEYVPPTKAEEAAILKEYLDTLENRGLDIDTTALGVYYVIDSVGNGTYPVEGDTCVIKYTGFFIGGGVFDTSGDDTWEFILGDDQIIDGWNDGMQVIDEEGEAFLIIPSEFAYGERGYGSVPPNTSIVFSIEMVEIKPLD